MNKVTIAIYVLIAFNLILLKPCLAQNSGFTSGNIKTEFAPETAKIESVDLMFFEGESKTVSRNSWYVRANVNEKINKESLKVFNNAFDQKELSIIKNNGISSLAFGSDYYPNPIDGKTLLPENEPAKGFFFSFGTEQTQVDKTTIGRVLLFGLFQEGKIKIYKYYLLYDNGEYEEMSVPKAEKIFTGYEYLKYNSICLEKPNDSWCKYLSNNILLIKFNLKFNSILAENHPLTYAVLYVLSFYLLGTLIALLILSYILTLIFQRKSWGVVFDTKTLKPIEGAIVRIFDKERNKLLETKVTGKDGRFNFLPGKGDFYITVNKPGYVFPSKTLSGHHHPVYYHLYHGEEVLIKADNAALVTNIPLDPTGKTPASFHFILIQRILYVLARLRWLLVIAVMLSIGVFLYLVYYVWKLDFFNPNWILYILIPIALIEFYLWWLGRKVKILKKEFTPEQRKSFAQEARAPVVNAPVEEEKEKHQPVAEKPDQPKKIIKYLWLKIIGGVVILGLLICIVLVLARVKPFACTLDNIIVKVNEIKFKLTSSNKSASNQTPSDSKPTIDTPKTDTAGKDFEQIPRYPGSVRESFNEQSDSTEAVYVVQGKSKDEIMNYYASEMTKKGWESKNRGAGDYLFTGTDSASGFKKCSLLIVNFSTDSSGAPVVKYKLTCGENIGT